VSLDLTECSTVGDGRPEAGASSEGVVPWRCVRTRVAYVCFVLSAERLMWFDICRSKWLDAPRLVSKREDEAICTPYVCAKSR
jgi:hypothetical protein